MFIGEYAHNLDDKGRLAIPIKFRDMLKNGAVITRGLDACLFIYTLDEWRRLAEKLAALPLGQAANRAFSRLMLAGAMDTELDKQGRVVVPEYLRMSAKLDKNVVIAGLYNRLEIWDESAWRAYKITTEQESNALAEKNGRIGGLKDVD
jgi:MraZ protein